MADLLTQDKDSTGRVLTFRKLNALQQSRLVRAAGEHAGNPSFMQQFVYPAATVSAIDGIPVPLPSSLKDIDAIIGQLDDAGMNLAIARIVAEMQEAKARLDAMMEQAADPLAPSAP